MGDATLFFGADLVGTIAVGFYSDLNWYGVFRPAAAIPARVAEFIRVCEEWHTRAELGQPHDAAEFDPWPDIHGSGAWSLVRDGVARPITCPAFWVGEVVWRERKPAEPGAAADRGLIGGS